MKKLLVLALVLGMASIASASLTINGLTISGSAGAITVVGTQTADFDLVLVSNGTLSPLDMTAFTSTAPTASTVLAGFSDLVAGDTVDDFSAYTTGAVFTLASYPNEAYKTGTYMNLAYSGATKVMAGVFNENTNALVVDAFGQGTGTLVNLIPEPMTLTLLGLGGLFLRRRK